MLKGNEEITSQIKYMGRGPKRSPTKEIKHQLQPRWAMQRSHHSPIDHENLSLLLTSIIWWSSQKIRTTHKKSNKQRVS